MERQRTGQAVHATRPDGHSRQKAPEHAQQHLSRANKRGECCRGIRTQPNGRGGLPSPAGRTARSQTAVQKTLQADANRVQYLALASGGLNRARKRSRVRVPSAGGCGHRRKICRKFVASRCSLAQATSVSTTHGAVPAAAPGGGGRCVGRAQHGRSVRAP